MMDVLLGTSEFRSGDAVMTRLNGKGRIGSCRAGNNGEPLYEVILTDAIVNENGDRIVRVLHLPARCLERIT